MGPISYIDRKYQEVVVRGQAGAFSAINDAQQNALQHILWVIRFLSSLPFVIFYVLDYFAVFFHARKRPEPRLEQLAQMVAQEKAADHHRKTGGKTFGFMKGGK